MKFNKFLTFGMAAASLLSACKKDEENKPSNSTIYDEVLQGNISTRTLDASKKYLIKGQVFVVEGATLTIPAGTILFGEKRTKGTLIVERGGKIIAEGTKEKPIIMTSNQEEGERDRGDWGGLVILGKAPVNQNEPVIEGISPEKAYGGTTSDDNSGTYKYLRVEYAGIELTPNNETNSITMGGVGSGTVMEYLQVSFGGDDGFEWFGGTVNGKYLVSLGTWDDDFDVDLGHSGKVQFGLAVRYPSYADQSGSNGFEVDNNSSGTGATPKTSTVFSNITVLGPRMSTRTAHSNNYQHALHLRRNSEISIFNSFFSGFPRMITLDDTNTRNNYTKLNNGVLANNIILAVGRNFSGSGSVSIYQAAGGTSANDIRNYWERTGGNNKTDTVVVDANTTPNYAAYGLKNTLFFAGNGGGLNTDYPSNPDFSLTSGTLSSGASFTHPKLAGFQSVTFRGAFGATDWTDDWTNFNPQNTKY